MSQAGIISTTAGPVPPTVPTQFTEDVGVAVPAGNNLNVLGGSGISTLGAGSTITISIQNATTNNAITVGAVTADIITVPLSMAINQTYTFDIRVAGICAGLPGGVGYNLFGTVRTDGAGLGATAFLVGTVDKIVNEDVGMTAADTNLIVSGNNAIIRVLGVAGLTIDWGAFAVYVTAIP